MLDESHSNHVTARRGYSWIRHLIELGGLVQKSGLVKLAGDDRATLYGAMLDLAGRAGDADGANALALWKRRGKRAFDAEAAEAASSDDSPGGEN